MKLTKKIVSITALVSIMITSFGSISLKAFDDEEKLEQNTSISDEIGVEVGSVLYDIDEFGNVIERVVDDIGAISEEEAEHQYYEKFIGSADEKAVDYQLISIDQEGKETVVSTHADLNEALSAYDAIIQTNPSVNYAVKSQDTYWKIKYATVCFKKIEKMVDDARYIANIDFKDANTGVSGYINPSYGIDAAYIETVNNQVKFKMGGVVGLVDASYVDVVPYSEKTTFVNYYKVSDGNIYHGIRSGSIKSNGSYSSSIHIGYAPSGLNVGTTYYSYDAHYFYTDYFKMIDDYRSNTYANAVNKDNPYYNYYQFLPLHSKTTYTAEELNRFFTEKGYTEKPTSTNKNDLTKVQSLLVGEGNAFIKGLEYGVNPVLSLGIAINESGWGRSSIALAKNNIFGLNAVDSNPSGAADTFISVESCVEIFMKQWVNWGYLDTNDWRYYGGHLGDKSSGMNVKYASDAYWGEKAASYSYLIDQTLGKKDFNTYKLAIKNTVNDVDIFKESSTSSSKIVTLKNPSARVMNMPVIILDAVSGESVSDNGIWYKVQTDHPLDENQVKITRKTHCPDNSLACLYSKVYNFDQSYGYVPSTSFEEISSGDGVVEEPVIYKKGDVNGDDSVTSLDYIQIKNHIMQTKVLSGDALLRADVNEDGKVTSLDYIKIKNHIMGTNPLF